MAGTGGCGRSEGPRRITVLFSNDLRGEIRSCGCAEHDLGGLGRRATFVAAVRDTAPDVIVVDAGGAFGTKVNYGRSKARLTLEALRRMGCVAMAPGEEEFGFGVDWLIEQVRRLDLPMLAVNVRDAGADTLLFRPAREVALPSGLRVAFYGAMSPRLRLPPQVEPGRVRIGPIEPALRREIERRRDADLHVLVAHMGRGEAQQLARRLEALDLIVVGSEGRPLRRIRRIGNAWLLTGSDRGLYAGIATCVLDRSNRIRAVVADNVPLDDRFADDPVVAKLFRAYDLEIAAKERSSIPAGVLEARRALRRPYAGVEACRECHEEIVAQWETTKHAHAFATLEERGRQYDRDCTPCHTTGFEDRGGFVALDVTPGLVNVQCESCHGNGHDHVADPDVATVGRARGACATCHRGQHSPEFDFDTYWPKIRHGD